MATVVGWVVLMVAAAVSLLALASRQGRFLSGSSLTALALLVSLPSMALEERSGKRTPTIAQGETVNDTLFASGESVEVDGVDNGDLFTAARSVTVRGTVISPHNSSVGCFGRFFMAEAQPRTHLTHKYLARGPTYSLAEPQKINAPAKNHTLLHHGYQANRLTLSTLSRPPVE